MSNPNFTNINNLDSRYVMPGDLPNLERGLRQVQNKVSLINAGIPARVKFVTYGDSYAQKVYTQLVTGGIIGGEGPLKRLYGGIAGGYGRDNANSGPGAGGPISGTYTNLTTAWDASADGIAYSITSGNSATFSVVTADTIKAYIINEPGGGTFKLQLNGSDVAGYTNVSALGTLGTLKIVTLTGLSTSGTQQLTIVGLSGTIRVLTWGWENTSISGLAPVAIYQGGIALNSPTSTAWSNWSALLSDIVPDVMTYEAKEASSYFAASLVTFFNATKAGAPNMDVIGIGTPPVVNDSSSDQATQNTQLKSACKTYGYIYYDTYQLFQAGSTSNGTADYNLLASIGATNVLATTVSGSTTLTITGGSPFPLLGASLSGSGIPASTYVASVNPVSGTLVMTNAANASGSGTNIAAGGWNGDGTHVLVQADQYRARALFEDLFIQTAFGRPIPFDVYGQSVSATAKMVLGKTPSAPVYELDADTGTDLDAYLYLKRALRYRLAGTASDLFILDARNNTGNPSVLPTASQFGGSYAGIVGTGAATLEVRQLVSGNLNNQGSVGALAFFRKIISANISGSYQVPVLTGGIFRLTLTASATITAANGSAINDGQEIQIEVIRGATVYSYSWGTQYNFAGGTAPTAGTTASRRDLYDFVFTGGGWRIKSFQIDVT